MITTNITTTKPATKPTTGLRTGPGTKIAMTRQERVALRKQAFDEIIGDPFSTYDIEGNYNILRNRSSIKAVDNSLLENEGQSESINPARPNMIDFLCDVEKAVEYGLKEFAKYNPGRNLDVLERNFILTYIVQEGEYLNQRDRAKIEQFVGKIFVARRISPMIRYFGSIRRRMLRGGRG